VFKFNLDCTFFFYNKFFKTRQFTIIKLFYTPTNESRIMQINQYIVSMSFFKYELSDRVGCVKTVRRFA